MNAAALQAWLLALAPILDGHGNAIPMPVPAARDIAIVAMETDNPPFYAATLRTFAALESGYRPSAAGDCPGMRAGSPLCTRDLGARSCGVVQTPCASTPKDALGQLRYGVVLLKRSMVACPMHPLSVYGTGRCSAWGASREALIRAALAVAVPEGEPS